MRQKTLRVILTFPTTTDAMAMEFYATQHAIAGRLIPVPAVISAGCGMCWSAPIEAKQQVQDAAQAAMLRTEGIFELMI